MNLNSSTFLSVDEVLSEAAFAVGDQDMRIRTLGWYRGRVKRALQNLALATNYYRRQVDLDITNDKVPIPPDLQDIHTAFCLQLDDTGKIIATQRLYPKTGYLAGSDTLAATNNPNAIRDHHTCPTIVSDTQVLYYTQQGTDLILSSAAADFKKVRLDYSGYGYDIATVGDAVIVPREAVEAVQGYIAVMYWQSRMGENPNLRPMYAQAYSDLYGRREGNMSLWEITKRQLIQSSPDEMRVALHNWRRKI